MIHQLLQPNEARYCAVSAARGWTDSCDSRAAEEAIATCRTVDICINTQLTTEKWLQHHEDWHTFHSDTKQTKQRRSVWQSCILRRTQCSATTGVHALKGVELYPGVWHKECFCFSMRCFLTTVGDVNTRLRSCYVPQRWKYVAMAAHDVARLMALIVL